MSRPAKPLEWMRALPPPAKDPPRAYWCALIWLGLTMHEDGTGWVTIARLAARAGVSDSTAKRAVAWARDAGWLERTTRGQHGRASTYRLTLPSWADDPNRSANDPLGSGPTGQTGRPNRSANDPPRGLIQEGARGRATGPGFARLLPGGPAATPGEEWDGQGCGICHAADGHKSGCRDAGAPGGTEEEPGVTGGNGAGPLSALEAVLGLRAGARPEPPGEDW